MALSTTNIVSFLLKLFFINTLIGNNLHVKAENCGLVECTGLLTCCDGSDNNEECW